MTWAAIPVSWLRSFQNIEVPTRNAFAPTTFEICLSSSFSKRENWQRMHLWSNPHSHWSDCSLGPSSHLKWSELLEATRGQQKSLIAHESLHNNQGSLCSCTCDACCSPLVLTSSQYHPKDMKQFAKTLFRFKHLVFAYISILPPPP